MTQEERKRLELLFELENIKTSIMYIAPKVNLKAVTDLSYKDPDGRKRRFYEEIRYKSDKYKNTDHLISANFHLNTYLMIDYPNPKYTPDNREMKTSIITIRGYILDELVTKMRLFNERILNHCFGTKNDEFIIYSDKARSFTIRINQYGTDKKDDTITFIPDIYCCGSEKKDKIPGVTLIFNNEYQCTIDVDSTWLELIYRLGHCDLTMLGFQMIQPFLNLLPGNAVTNIGGSYNSTSRYAPYYAVEDPDDIANAENSVSVNPSKRSNEYKKHIFDL
jgi:hypothetical protein